MIETERLVLRRWQAEDAGSLFLYASDDRVGPAAGWREHKTLRESRAVIQNILTGNECYAICLKHTDAPIGCAELRLNGKSNVVRSDSECELGYWLGVPFWGNGYMPEAANALLARAFLQLDMQAVWCGYYEGNNQSRRVQEKCGFVRHHIQHDMPVEPLNTTRTCIYSILTKEQWQKNIK